MNDSDLQKIDGILQKRLKGFATKEDLQQFATKEDIQSLATKRDLKSELSKYATKDDLKKLATKEDLDDLLGDIIEAVDKNKAEKTQVVKLEKRINRIEEDLQIPTQQ